MSGLCSVNRSSCVSQPPPAPSGVTPPAQPTSTTPPGHSTRDTFDAGNQQQSCASGQCAQKKKRGFFKQLLEQLMPMLQQLLGQLGQQAPQPTQTTAQQ